MLELTRFLPYLLIIAFPVLQTGKAVAADREALGEECYELLHPSDSEHSRVEKQQGKECLTRFYKLSTLIVTPLRRPESLQQSAASVSVVTSRDIERSAADGVAEVLRDIPGIDVTDSGQAGLKRIRLRGEEARRVRIMIDGQEFSDQREVGTPILIAPELIERIEVVRGTGSVLHGSRAIGGVINIITKKEGYHPLQATIGSSFDTATEGHQTVASAYGTVKGIGYRFAGTFAEHGDRDTPAGELENTSFRNKSWNGYLAKEWGEHRLAFSYDDYRSDSEIFVDPVVRTTPPFTDFRIDAPVRDRRKLAFFYDGDELNETVQYIHLDGYYQISDREFNTFSDVLLNFGGPLIPSSTSIFTSSELDTIGINGLITLNLGQTNTLALGFESKRDELDQDRRRLVTTGGVTANPELTVEGASQASIELFGENIWKFAQDWSLRGGARGIWVETELDNTTRNGFSLQNSSDLGVLGALGLSYTGLENMTFWTGWSQGFVYPTMINVVTGAFAGRDFVNPNPDLETENSNSVDAGVRYSGKQLNAELGLFNTWAKDFIDHVPCSDIGADCAGITGTRDRIYANINEARTFGLEFSGALRLNSITPYANLTWLRRRFENNGTSTYDTGLPALSGRFGIEGEHQLNSTTFGWVDLFLRAASSADEPAGSAIENHPGWVTINFALGLNLAEKQQYRLTAEFLNLANKEYTPATENLVARGRSAFVRFVADF